jgi:lysozyme
MGVDVSHHNGKNIDWAKVKEAGNSFAYCKATEGATYTDETYALNVKGAREAGVHPGPYHFYRVTADPIKQAEHFVSVIKAAGYDKFCLPPALDLEDREGMKKTKDAVQMRKDVHAFLQHVGSALKRKMVLYVDPDFAQRYLDGSFGGTFLFIANYRVSAPHIPHGWMDWTFWQETDTGTVDGIGSGVDLDRFRLGAAHLEEWIAGTILK